MNSLVYYTCSSLYILHIKPGTSGWYMYLMNHFGGRTYWASARKVDSNVIYNMTYLGLHKLHNLTSNSWLKKKNVYAQTALNHACCNVFSPVTIFTKWTLYCWWSLPSNWHQYVNLSPSLYVYIADNILDTHWGIYIYIYQPVDVSPSL